MQLEGNRPGVAFDRLLSAPKEIVGTLLS